MLRHLALRLAWAIPTLLGIVALTFVVFRAVPADRALAELAERRGPAATAELEALRVRYGLVDPATGRRLTVGERLSAFVGRTLRFEAPPGEDRERYRRRFGTAVRVTFFLGGLALVVALSAGVPLGSWLGRRRGGTADALVSAPMLGLAALPEFLFGTLLILFLAGAVGPAWFPPGGLRSPGSAGWPWYAQAADLVHHTVLPVATLAVGPAVVVTRFVRESVSRASRAPWVATLRGFGMSERRVRRRVLRNALAPLCTQLGTLVPMLLVGSVIVERMFALPGLGRLLVEAVERRDLDTVGTLTLFGGAIVLASLVGSDVAHRIVDPRVRLA